MQKCRLAEEGSWCKRRILNRHYRRDIMALALLISYNIALIPQLHGAVVYFQPEQIHLAYGGNSASDIIVTWSTGERTNSTIVEYGFGGSSQRALGSSSLFEDHGDKKRAQYIHRVTLSNLTAGQLYRYHCGSELGWSAAYYFKTPSASLDYTFSFAVFGDLGHTDARALPQLQEDAQKNYYDAIIHVGDFAYNLHSDNGKVGDIFLNQIEPVAAYVPYMTCPGNHENSHNFTHYRARFSMPGLPNDLFYSFNLGPVHFISLNTETYFTPDGTLQDTLWILEHQHEWLVKDLQEANKPENRQKNPWIVIYMHKPMYCSDSEDQCTQKENIIRDGIPVLNGFGLEKLFYENGVDLLFVGHEHSYERTLPVYKGEVYNGSAEAAYTNPKAPVHIKTGSPGADAHSEGYRSDPLPWSAFRTLEYGFTKFKVYNTTHLYLEQVSSDRAGEIIDQIWLIQEKHGSFASQKE